MRRAAARLPSSVLCSMMPALWQHYYCSASTVQLNVYALDTDITRMLSQRCSCYRPLRLANLAKCYRTECIMVSVANGW